MVGEADFLKGWYQLSKIQPESVAQGSGPNAPVNKGTVVLQVWVHQRTRKMLSPFKWIMMATTVRFSVCPAHPGPSAVSSSGKQAPIGNGLHGATAALIVPE